MCTIENMNFLWDSKYTLYLLMCTLDLYSRWVQYVNLASDQPKILPKNNGTIKSTDQCSSQAYALDINTRFKRLLNLVHQ